MSSDLEGGAWLLGCFSMDRDPAAHTTSLNYRTLLFDDADSAEQAAVLMRARGAEVILMWLDSGELAVVSNTPGPTWTEDMLNRGEEMA